MTPAFGSVPRIGAVLFGLALGSVFRAAGFGAAGFGVARALPPPAADSEAPKAPAPTPVDSEIVTPRAVDAPAVPYPVDGVGAARVVLEAEIAEDGTALAVDVREGREPFASAARHAVATWRFTPARRNGLPVRARISLAIVFEPPVEPNASEQSVSEPNAALPNAALPNAALPLPADSTPAPGVRAPEPLGTSPARPVEVTVSGEQRRELGAIHVPRHEARLVPGAFADPFRVIEVMPGVTPILSGIPYFYVRGAPPGNVGYFVDGIRLPLLFHVGAGPSVLAPALVDRVDLFASSYPARYGRFSGGIMAGETMSPRDRARGEAQARIFDAGALLEVPFDEARGSLLLAGRYSYTQALLALVAPDFELGYWDYQARLSYRIAPAQRLTLFGFGALDRLERTNQPTPLFDTRFHRLDARFDHDTETAHTRVALTLGVDRVALSEEDADQGSLQENRSLLLRLNTDRRLSHAWLVRAGIEAGVDPIDVEREFGFGGQVDFGGRTDVRGAAFVDAVYRPRRGLEIVPGLRMEQARARGDWHSFPEPRLATRLRLRHGLAWESAFGIANQLPTVAVRAPGRAPNALELLPQQAWQASESLETLLPGGMIGKFTLSHTWTDAEPLSSRNYGAEAFLRRDFTHRLGGFLSYTLSWARGSAGRASFPTAYDRRHVLSLVLGYRLGDGYRIGGRAYYNSGRPYNFACATPECGPADPAAARPFLVSGRFPAFLRADLRLEKRWDLGQERWFTAAFEWFNAGVARERDGLAWSPEQGGLRFTSRSPLTLPSIGVEGGF